MKRARENFGEENRDIDRMKKQRVMAQDKGDIKEETALCNALGDQYFKRGEYERALHYHQCELALSLASGCLLDQGVASRKVGECFCELGEFEEAMKHQKNHLFLSRRLQNLTEEQRALATLGRTFYIYSQSEQECEEVEGEERVAGLLLDAGTHYLQSLEVCDRLVGQLSDGELLEMRSRLYLNLGLVYEMKKDFQSARMFMMKALGILEELKDSETIYQCHSSLGSLHLLEHHDSLSLHSFQRALKVASELRNRRYEAVTLREMAQVYLRLSEFEDGKSCLKRFLKISESVTFSKDEIQSAERHLKAVRKISYFLDEVEKSGHGDGRGKTQLYDKLGDLCCALKAYPAAVKFYGRQLNIIEEEEEEDMKWSPQEVSLVYVSLARTLEDCGQFLQALHYYHKELQVWTDRPPEESDSWSVIARVRETAGMEPDQVMDAYNKAAELAEGVATPRKLYSLYKTIVNYIRRNEDSVGSSKSNLWHKKVSQYLETHPTLAEEEEEEGEAEDSQGLDQCVGDTPDELGQSSIDESEEEEEDEGMYGVGVASSDSLSSSIATRKNTKIGMKLEKRNWRGETLLQVAVINEDLVTVKRLLKKGAAVNTRDNCGWTPLHEACNYGYLEIARVLVESGAFIDDAGGAGCEGVTCLIDAVTNGHKDVVKMLVEKGADLRIKDAHGRTALAVVDERQSSADDSDQECSELEEKHRLIHTFLRTEMRRHGYHMTTKPGGMVKMKRKSVGSGAAEGVRKESEGCSDARQDGRTGIMSGDARRDKEEKICLAGAQEKGRWGNRILYDSNSDEDGGISCDRVSKSRSKQGKAGENPFKDFTVNSPALRKGSSLFLDRVSHYPPNIHTANVMPAASTGSVYSLPRGVFNPLGQVEILGPSLIADDMEKGEEEEDTNCYPLVDNWLVDDLGKAKRKRRKRDWSVERESRSMLGLAASGTVPTNSRGCSSFKTKTVSSRTPQTTNLASRTSEALCGLVANQERRVDEGGSGGSGRGGRRGGSNAVIVSSSEEEGTSEEEDDEEDFKRWKARNEERHATHSSFPHSSPPPHTHFLSSFSPLPPPLRIKVRILNSSYLIPCPHYLSKGRDSPVSWLITQATERYFSQQGRRPVLSLRTIDGASLCPADPIAHVLKQDEEVVGMVEQWFSPPLAERYLVACRTSGVECHSKVLELFKKDTNPSMLDLSNFDLRSRDSTSLFQALQSQHSLTTISLSGNKLHDDSMPRLQLALGELPSLRSLDLSSTGITHQGVYMLATKSLSNGSNLWQSLHTLRLSHNKLGMASVCGMESASGGCGLGTLVSMCRSLQELYVDACGISCEVLESLVQPLKGASDLKVVSCAKNPLGAAGLCLLWEAISDLQVTSLYISRVVTAKNYGGRPFGAILRDGAAAKYFKNGGGQYLEVLDISYCYHSDSEALSALIGCLKHCASLRELRMAGWGLAGGHISSLCSFISCTNSLCYLDVSGNISLGNDGALNLLNACQSRLEMGGSRDGGERAKNEGYFPQMSLNLVACGIESPLSNELIRTVIQLRVDGGQKSVWTFKLDLFGNLIDKRDMSLLSV